MIETLENIFLFLQGQWDLERSTNGHGNMKGIATFTPTYEDPLALFYREEGEHILENGESLSFFKEYIYDFNNFYLDVCFAYNKKRGNLLHRLMFSEGSKDCIAQGEHCCGQDIYLGIYQFLDTNRFTIHYTIKGPRKNIRIQTRFQRQSHSVGRE